MKKIFLLTMLTLLLMTEITSATELVSCNPSPPGLWIRIDIIFHKPSRNCERGFGICFDVTVGFDGSVPNVERATCPVKLRLNERNQLLLEVTQDALARYEQGTTLAYFKGQKEITLTDPYTFSAGTCRALGSTAPLTIKPGIYPVLFENGTYTVVFQL